MSNLTKNNFDNNLKISGIKRHKGYDFYFQNYIFAGINLKNARILDVGGGNGIASFFAAHFEDTCECTVIDPLDDGSNNLMLSQFKKLSQIYPNRVNFYQGYVDILPSENKYDLIIMHNSINHIGEDLIKKVDHDKNSMDEYMNRLEKILSKANKNALIIISDCARRNFWGDLNLPNLLAPTIEWELHKQPSFWQSMLKNLGYRHIKTKWTARREFGYLGKYIFANIIFSYFMQSHFVSFYEFQK